MTTQFQTEGFEPHAHSQTAIALQELQLWGTRAFDDEPDLRPMPEPETLMTAVADIFDALVAILALTGGTDFNDHRLIWGKLDQVQTKYPDMILLHGGSPKGAELIAAKWAEARGVTQVAFKPDWTKHAKAAPFKRNDAMLDVLPVGVLVFPGNGIQENLADKAKKLGIPVVKFERGA